MTSTLLEQVAAVLSTTAGRWHELTRTIPIDLLERAPQPGEWSALQCLQHLVDTEEWVFPARVQAVPRGEDFVGFDPDTQGRVDHITLAPPALAARFDELRTQSLAALAHVTVADLERTGVHSQLGVVNLSELLHEWGGHDLMHLVQAERAIMQPFIAGTGPWRSYFADHDVGDA